MTIPVSADLPCWDHFGEPRYVQGYIHGAVHPSIVLELKIGSALSPDTADAIERLLSDRLPSFASPDVPLPAVSSVQEDRRYGVARFLGWIWGLRRLAHAPIDLPGHAFTTSSGAMCVVIPCEILVRDAQKALIMAVIGLIDAAIRGGAPPLLLTEIADLYERLAENCTRTGNSLLFFRAAVDRKFTVRELPGGVLQFGTGSASRRMRGSFTEMTPVIATQLAGDKRLCAELLRQSGVPSPVHRTAQSADQAVTFANALGYPVVIKPADLDGGQGVVVRLETDAEVRAAFDQCRKLSANVIVEKFIVGRDYRIVVMHDKAIWAVERVPGGVTGNGADTIAELIEAYNAHPLRTHGPKPPLGKLLLDEEADMLMRKRGLDAQSVLPKGEFLQLRRAANVASGGTPVAAFAGAHPDNLAIAVRATRALRLDLAGIDLIVPDITRSWRETGGAICEVNAAPVLGQMTSAHVYGEILDTLLPRSGRIPVVLIVGAENPSVLAQQVSNILSGCGLTVGCHTLDGIWIGKENVAQGRFIGAAAGHLLAIDPQVDAMVLCMNDFGWETTGLAVDRYDILLLAGASLTGKEDMAAMLRGILPACTGAVIPLRDAGTIPAQPLANGARWNAEVSATDLPELLRSTLNLKSVTSITV